MTTEDQQAHQPNPSRIDQKKLPQGPPGDPPDKGAVSVQETGGPPGPEPTRYGDWEKNGRCIDF